MPATTKDPYLEELPGHVAAVFQQAQVPPVNYRKNCVNLHKIQDRSKDITEDVGRDKIRVTGEIAFQQAFLECLFRVLPTKKGDLCGDRVVRFIGAYMKFANERADEEQKARIDSGEIEQGDDEDTWGTRFTAKVVRSIAEGFGARDKAVRYRCTQIFESTIPHLGLIEEELYLLLRKALLDRTKDKEYTIRSNAAKCLAVLCPHETPEDARDGEPTVQETLLEMLSNDSSPEVRNFIVSNITLNTHTIPHIIKRTRDKDSNIRKLVYKQVLVKGVFEKYTSVLEDGDTEEYQQRGPCHPANLPLETLETIIKNGLRDRDPAVQAAAALLIDEWVKAFELESVKPEPDVEERAHEGVIELLKLFEVDKRVHEEELGVVEDLLKSVFGMRRGVFEGVEFQAEYWNSNNLTPETALIPRVFVEYCRSSDSTKGQVLNNNNIVEENLPVVSDVVKCIFNRYQALLLAASEQQQQQEEAEEEKVEVETEILKRVFILRELLKFAPLLDYSDQFGCRVMDPLIRRLVEEDRLPLSLIPPCLDILRKLSRNEYEFIKTVVGIVDSIHDGVEDDAYYLDVKQRQSLPEDDQARLDELDLRQLDICVQMLKRTNAIGNHEGIGRVLDDFIVPNLNRHHNARIMEAAMTCLGLCALVYKKRAPNILIECMKMILNPGERNAAEIQVILYKTVFDLLLNYGDGIYALVDPKVEGFNQEIVHGLLIKQLDNLDDLRVLAVVCEGLVKMILTGYMTSPVAIIHLLQRWTDPAIREYQPIMQCLSYFFQRYSHSSAKNQQTMQTIFMDVFKSVAADRQKLGEDEEMISSPTLCVFFENWTNPLVLAEVLNSKLETAEYFVQLDMAAEILKELFEKSYKFQKEDKKALFQLLPKLYMPEPDDHTDGLKVVPIKLLIEGLRKYKSLDGPSNTALTKFEKDLNKKYEKQLEGFSEEEYRSYDGLNELYEFLDDLIPLNDEDEDSKVGIVPPGEARTRGQKRRSRSTRTSGTTATETDELETPAPQESGSRARKRARLSTGTTDDDGDHSMQSCTKEEELEMSVPPPPRPRPKPKGRTSTGPPGSPEVIYVSSGSDGEGPSAPTASSRPQPRPRPRPRPRPTGRSGRRSPPPALKQEEDPELEEEREEDIDRDISDLLRSQRISSPSPSEPSRNISHVTVGHDSLFSTDDEEEEDEVSGLLAN